MQTQNQSRDWIFFGLGTCAVMAATFGISTLNAWSDKANHHEQRLHQLLSIANRLDALEWRAIAKQKVNSDLESTITQQREEAVLTLNALRNTSASAEELQKVTLAYQTYAIAVDKLFSLLVANQLEKALEVDEIEVDPSYDNLYKIIVEEAAAASKNAEKLGRWANLGAILISLSLVATIGLLFQQYLKANQQLHRMVVDNILRRETSLEQERQILESKVIKRTQELQEANAMLIETLTDLKQSQVQIIQSEKMSMLGQLVAGVAHEINNPVTFLAGNINPALDYVKDLFRLMDLYQQKYPQPDPEIQDQINAIDLAFLRDDLPKLIGSMIEGVTRIRDISNGLRTFSRADITSPVPCNLHEGIDSTLMILKHRLKANEVRPEIEVLKEYGQLPSVECYAGQINQVLMNILANAIDALEESNQGRSFGEIQENPNQITIKTRLNHENQSAIISIKDNGVGIPDDVKQKIFDHLFTTKGVGKGTGLGLAIAHQIVVEKHGGTLDVNSILGQGAELVIAIPLRSKRINAPE